MSCVESLSLNPGIALMICDVVKQFFLCGLFSCCLMCVFVCGKRTVLHFLVSSRAAWNCVSWVLVCVLWGCLINVLISLTQFRLAWYFVPLVSSLMSHRNIDICSYYEIPCCLIFCCHLCVTSMASTSILHINVCVCANVCMNVAMSVWKNVLNVNKHVC